MDLLKFFAVILTNITVLHFRSYVAACKTDKDSHLALVSHLKTSDYVQTIMNLTDRGCFVTKDPYSVQSQSIEFGGSILDPNTHALILEQLRICLSNGARALVLESGSGYLTASISLMTGSSGVTTSVPPNNQLLSLVKKNIQNWLQHEKAVESYGVKSVSQIKFVARDNQQSWLSGGPYNGIFIHNAGSHVSELANKLELNGRLIGLEGPVGGQQELFRIEHYPKGTLRRVTISTFSGVPSLDRPQPEITGTFSSDDFHFATSMQVKHIPNSNVLIPICISIILFISLF